jgi:hypothetical protein
VIFSKCRYFDNERAKTIAINCGTKSLVREKVNAPIVFVLQEYLNKFFSISAS